MGKALAAGILAAIIAVLIGVANYSYANRTQTDFSQFQQSVCAVSKAQVHTSREFQTLLQTLERRAVEREQIDTKAGNVTAAAADSDSARLYLTILNDYQAGARHPVSIKC